MAGGGGPALGLGSTCDGRDLEMSVDSLEEFRGGNVPEEVDEDEEWDDNWRVPREYFSEEGVISAEKRVELLRSAGHRRSSVDLNSHTGALLKARRLKHSRSKVGLFIIQGLDIDEVYALDQQVDSVRTIGDWLYRVRSRRARAHPLEPGK